MLKKLTKAGFLLCLCLALFATVTCGQKNSITGKVTGTNKEPVSGATVTIKGTTIATQTDGQGRFTITVVKENSTLIISNVGFESEEITSTSSEPLDIFLKSTNTALTEIVVTGYTSQAKKDITGSVAVVNVKELIANPGSNIQSLLQGRAAG